MTFDTDSFLAQERFSYAADKLARALQDMEIAYAEVLGSNTAIDAHLRLAMKHATAAFDLACGEVQGVK